VSGGSGLGLSVVRAIAMAHQGDVKYETSSEGGAIFEIGLPREA
jgi:two-component system sensor histidine kinase AdeS